MLKCLRIAVTVLCLTACVLFVALWVRSYSRLDGAYAQLNGSPSYGIISLQGRLRCGFERPAIKGAQIGFISTSLQSLPGLRERTASIYNVESFPGGWALEFPHYLAIVIASIVGGMPWIRRRFSVRTLLIATTLIAVILGVIVVAR